MKFSGGEGLQLPFSFGLNDSRFAIEPYSFLTKKNLLFLNNQIKVSHCTKQNKFSLYSVLEQKQSGNT